MKKWIIGDRMEIKGYDAWLLFECTDDYDDDMPEDYDSYDGYIPDDDDYIDDEYNNYIGG